MQLGITTVLMRLLEIWEELMEGQGPPESTVTGVQSGPSLHCYNVGRGKKTDEVR